MSRLGTTGVAADFIFLTEGLVVYSSEPTCSAQKRQGVHTARFYFGANVVIHLCLLPLVMYTSANHSEGVQLELSPIRNEPN